MYMLSRIPNFKNLKYLKYYTVASICTVNCYVYVNRRVCFLLSC